jgi:hypothetical protein
VDPSGIQGVRLRLWFTPLEGDTQERTTMMTPADNLYAASFGPLGAEGTLRYRIEAQDKAGNVSNTPVDLREVTYGLE